MMFFWRPIFGVNIVVLEVIKKKVLMSTIIHDIPSMSSAYCQWDFKKSFPPTLLTKTLEILLDHKKHKRGNIETCSEQITRMVYRVPRWTLDKPEERITDGPDTRETLDQTDYQQFVSGFTIVKSHRRLLQNLMGRTINKALDWQNLWEFLLHIKIKLLHEFEIKLNDFN